MNDETPEPFDTVGDEPVEARIVAWVLGESSAFESAELERLCGEKPELLVFRRRMRALHGLLTEAEASEADHSWKLPPDKRKALDAVLGEEIVTSSDQEKEARIGRAGLRTFFAIAACLVLAVILLQLVRPVWVTRTMTPELERSVDFMPQRGGGGQSTASFGDADRDGEFKTSDKWLDSRKLDSLDQSLAAVERQEPAVPSTPALPPAPAAKPAAAAAAGYAMSLSKEKDELHEERLTVLRSRLAGETKVEAPATAMAAGNAPIALADSSEITAMPRAFESGLAQSLAGDKNSKDSKLTESLGQIADEEQVPAAGAARFASRSKVETRSQPNDMPSLSSRAPLATGSAPDSDKGFKSQSEFGLLAGGSKRRASEAPRDSTGGDLADSPMTSLFSKTDAPEIPGNLGLEPHDASYAGMQMGRLQQDGELNTYSNTADSVTGGRLADADSFAEPTITADSGNKDDVAFIAKAENRFPSNVMPSLSYKPRVVPGQPIAGIVRPPVEETAKEVQLRSNAALTKGGSGKVDQVRRGLYAAEGSYNLGNYDEAKSEYEKVLQSDPYNGAARRGLERISQAKTDYYRAAYDQTRAELLSEVDAAWELEVPAEQQIAGKKVDSKLKQLIAKQPLIVETMDEVSASGDPYSTFSLNINDASFQLAKAALAKGERPDSAAIKLEQFYNAVDYGDSAPSSTEPVTATLEQSAHPVIPGRNLLRIALRTASVGRAPSQPLRLTLLVDQSGSMVREDRRAAMQHALTQLGGLLTANDVVTVVGFSRTPHLLADRLTGGQGKKLGDIINQAASEGGTNLEEAMKLGGQMAERQQLAGAQNRIVLFTDGAANLGDADPDRLSAQVTALRQKGIAFDIAGIGADDLNDRLLGDLARHGNGRYYVVGDSKDDSFARQLAGAFRPAAENVKVQVIFNPLRVGNYKLLGFEKDRLKAEDFRNDAVDAAELAVDEAGVALYQVETLPDGKGEIGEVSVRFRDTASGEMVERSWTIPREESVPAFDRATPSMQLAGLSLLAAEKLRGGPLADAIDFKQLTDQLAEVRRFYQASPRVGEMLQVIDAIK